MANRIQLRRDTSGNWSIANPILAQGEMGYETDTNQFKIGDGVTVWTNLPYFASGGGGGGGEESSVRLAKVFTPDTRYNGGIVMNLENGVYSDLSIASEYEKEVRQKGFTSPIQFITNLSKSKLIQEKDNLYITIDRFKKDTGRSDRQANLKFRRQNDRRYKTNLTAYCWRFNEQLLEVETENPTDYVYFYTLDYFANSADLVNADPTIYTFHSNDNAQDLFESNWVTCLNALSNYGVLSDITGDDSLLQRAPEFDVDTVVARNDAFLHRMYCRKYSDGTNNYFLWSPTWKKPESEVYGWMVDGELVANRIPKKVSDLEVIDTVGNLDLSFVEDRKDLLCLMLNEGVDVHDTIKNLNDQVFNVAVQPNAYNTRYFKLYWRDYPIEPVRLSDCEVLVMESLPPVNEEILGYDVGTWVNFDELINDEYGLQQWELLQQPVFRLPYDTFYLWLRFSGWQKKTYYQYNRNIDGGYPFQQRYKNTMPQIGRGYIEEYRRTGSNYKYKKREFNPHITEYLEFNIETYEDIIHNKRNNSQPTRMRLSVGGSRRSTLL